MTPPRDEDHSPAMNAVVATKLAAFKSIYIPYPKHVELHARLDFLQKLAACQRGQPQMGLRVLAPSGSGKSTAARQYQAIVERGQPAGSTLRPVLYIPLDRATTTRRLMVSILVALGDPQAEKGSEQTLKRRVVAYLERLGVELLIIDEVQHLNWRSTVGNDVTDALKTFLDAGVVAIAFLGTGDAEGMFKRNLQLNGRLLAPFDLPPLKKTSTEDHALFGNFVESLNTEIVRLGIFPELANFSSPKVLGALHDVSQGVVGRISRLFEVAVEIALRRRAERLEVYDLALAVDRWAIPQAFTKVNPFRLGGRDA
jgi:hypothetical protein